MEKETMNILFAGAGGQGIVLASRILAHCAFKSGFDVKESEIHGMAQRGGAVVGQIRFGRKVHSPSIPPGTAHLLLALEEMEALRYLHFLSEDAIVVLNEKKIPPASLDPSQYPQDIEERIKKRGYKLLKVSAEEIAKKLGSSKVENIVLLGVLSPLLPFKKEVWLEVIAASVPEKFKELNLKAFEEGRALGETLLQSQN